MAAHDDGVIGDEVQEPQITLDELPDALTTFVRQVGRQGPGAMLGASIDEADQSRSALPVVAGHVLFDLIDHVDRASLIAFREYAPPVRSEYDQVHDINL